MKRWIASVLAAGLLLTVSVYAQPREAESELPTQEMTTETRLWLIGGGTVLVVAGMWHALYTRGKK